MMLYWRKRDLPHGGGAKTNWEIRAAAKREEKIARARLNTARYTKRLEVLESDLTRVLNVALTTPSRADTVLSTSLSPLATREGPLTRTEGSAPPGSHGDVPGPAITDFASSSGTSGTTGTGTGGTLPTGFVPPTPERRRLEFSPAGSPGSGLGFRPEFIGSNSAAALAAEMQRTEEALNGAFATITELSARGLDYSSGEEKEARYGMVGGPAPDKWSDVIIKILYACTRSNERNGCRTLTRLIEKDFENYLKPPGITDLAMAIELDSRRKFACWVNVLFFTLEELTSRNSDANFRAYNRFHAQLNANERTKWFFVDAHEEDALTKVLNHYRSHASVSQDFVAVPALPVVAPPERAIRKMMAQEAADSEEDETPAKKPPPKKAKKILTVDVESEDPRPASGEDVVALIQRVSNQMSDRVTAGMNQAARDNQARMDRMAKENRDEMARMRHYVERDRNRDREHTRDSGRRDNAIKQSGGGSDRAPDRGRGGGNAAGTSNRGPQNFQRQNPQTPSSEWCPFEPYCIRPGCLKSQGKPDPMLPYSHGSRSS